MKLALAALSAAALAQAQHAADPAPDFVPTKLEAPLLEQFTDSSVPPRLRSLDFLHRLIALLFFRAPEQLGGALVALACD